MQRTVEKEFATFLTQAGKDIMGRVLRGEITLSFDKCKVGSGLWPVTRNEVDGKVDFTIDVPEQLLSPIADGVFDIDSLVGRSSGVTQATVNIPPTFGPATINEAAWLLEDGTVYAITRYAALPVMPPESGGSSEVSLRAFLNVGDVESVTLVVDSAINASREFVELGLQALEAKLSKDASTEQKGLVQLSSALDSESEEEAATSKAVKALYEKIKQEERTRILGQPFWHLGEEPPLGAMQFAGQILNRVQFKTLFDSLQVAERNIKWVTEADKLAGKLFGCWSLGDGNTTFGVPDPRGDFIRVWDNGRGADVDRILGSLQNPTRIRELLDLYSGTDNAFAIGASEIDGVRSNYVGGSRTATELSDTTFYRASITNYPGVGDNTGFAVRPRNNTWMLCFYYE